MIKRRMCYPLADWMDGQEHSIRRGPDFAVSVASMQAMLHQAAKRHGKRVATESENEIIWFQFTVDTQPATR